MRWNQRLALSFGSLVVLAALPAMSRADVLIGDWESGSTDGWIDWSSGQTAITAPKYTSATDVGVTHGTSSLHLDQSGWNQSLSVKLQDVGHKADFFANKQFQIDITLPATTQSGWSQIYAFVINAEGYGFTTQGNAPRDDAQWGWGDGGGAAQTHTFTVDYSALVDGDPSNGEIDPSARWVEFVLATNNDGVHTSYYFDNARLTGGAPPRLAGDVNGDGFVNSGDINAFIFALSHDAAGFATQYPTGIYGNADVNGDAHAGDTFVNAADINPFIQILSGTGEPGIAAALAAVPEPTSLGLLGAGAAGLLARRRRN